MSTEDDPRRKRKLSNKRRGLIEAEFDDLASACLRQLGAVEVPGSRELLGRPEWTLTTRAGQMTVSAHGDWIACHFEDEPQAVQVLGDGMGRGNYTTGGPVGVNRFTGKWNWHFGPWMGLPGECERAIEAFRDSVEKDLVSHAE